MKRLNKKGFTLVELLAVIVILALLIVVVATTALPAMNNAKKNALETYAKRVVENAKSLVAADSSKCTATAKCTVTDIMGSEATEYTSSDIVVTGSLSEGFVVNGTITDGDYTVTITDNSVGDAS